MRKQLGTLTSLLFLIATAALWMGCSHYWSEVADSGSYHVPYYAHEQGDAHYHPHDVIHHDGHPAICPAPVECHSSCAPEESHHSHHHHKYAEHKVAKECEPSCAPQPCGKLYGKCHYPCTTELCCRDGITVTARNPELCMLGDQYPIELEIKACDDVCDVTVVTYLPEGVSYVKSLPEAKVEGRRVVWDIGGMKRGECRSAKLWVKCECEGEQCACFCATAIPVRFCSLLCAKPVLNCEKCGPDEVRPGDPVHYTITVSNTGSCAAEDVVVTDQVPDGLEHSSCLKSLTYKLGSLEPCETKQIELCFTAVKRGRVCNTAVVTACNADSTSCQWCTNIFKECVEIHKVGPKEQSIGKNADYQITVTNTGDKTLTDVVVTDVVPHSTSIVAANGATVLGNRAVWRLAELKAGEKANFAITLTTCIPGCFTNRVHVTDCQGCEACDEFTTRWKGKAALNVTICETEDPICIGETTSYNIAVVNQGSESDSHVAIVVTFPPEVTPIASTGDSESTISGQTVTFTPIESLPPRSTARVRVDAKAVASGDARVNVSVTSDSIKTPITQQESTIVN